MANLTLISDWVTASRLTILTAMAEPGDLIEFDRGVNHHWGLFAGLRYVNGRRTAFLIHFCGTNEIGVVQALSRKGSISGKSGIISEPLVDVIFDDDRVRINNSLDKSYNPSAVQAIVQRAMDLIDSKDWLYDLTNNNCEHFATFCRYGEKVSLQERTPTEATGVGLGTAVVVGLGAAAALAIFARK